MPSTRVIYNMWSQLEYAFHCSHCCASGDLSTQSLQSQTWLILPNPLFIWLYIWLEEEWSISFRKLSHSLTSLTIISFQKQFLNTLFFLIVKSLCVCCRNWMEHEHNLLSIADTVVNRYCRIPKSLSPISNHQKLFFCFILLWLYQDHAIHPVL